MNFSCDRCLARFSTSGEPVPGRTYRVPCACGNTMVVEIGDLGTGARLLASAEFELAPAAPDDPFLPPRARANGRVEVTQKIEEERLAQRDPYAPSDESSEYRITGAVTFDEVLRRVRMKGFLAGAAAGALGAALIAAGLALATARPVATTTVAVPALPAPAAEPAREPIPGPSRPPAPGRTEAAAGAAPDGAAGSGAAVPPAGDGPLAEAVADATAPSLAPADPATPDPARDAAPGPPATASAADGPAPEPVAGSSGETPAAETPGLAPAAAASGPPPPVARPRRPFPESEVAEALRARRAAVADCVAGAPGDASSSRQAFSIAVVIDPSGTVSDVKIDDPEIEATPLGVCLVRVAHTMSFAPFEGEPYRVELALGYGDPE